MSSKLKRKPSETLDNSEKIKQLRLQLQEAKKAQKDLEAKDDKLCSGNLDEDPENSEDEVESPQYIPNGVDSDLEISDPDTELRMKNLKTNHRETKVFI